MVKTKKMSIIHHRIEKQMNESKKAIVISLHDDISEIIQLAESIQYTVDTSFIQHRTIPDVTSYIGSGKIKEIQSYLETSETQIELILVDGELKPSQWFYLEKKFSVTVYDRIRIILDIFKQRADRKEARLQVRLAELSYEKPYVRELIHRSRSGEHPGLMAGGEYQVDDYYEMIKKQMKHIKEELASIRKDREIQRQHRQTSGYYLVSLAGYTNAGKSSLLNLLSQEQITVENKLFSTLSTTTRRVETSQIPVLITDTVGFIQRLPAWIIDAFHSTLEELEQSDVVVLVIDASDDETVFKKKLETSIQELADLNVDAPLVLVLNKIDRVSSADLKAKIESARKIPRLSDQPIVSISVKNQTNIKNFLDSLHLALPQRVTLTFQLPNNEKSQRFISWLYEKTHIIDINYSKQVSLTVECNQKLQDKIIARIHKLNGKMIE
mgnify:CR=1 FL=1